jgi:hypothetical protein
MIRGTTWWERFKIQFWHFVIWVLNVIKWLIVLSIIMGLRHQLIIFILRPTGWIIAISRDVTLYFLELLYELKDLPLYIASELRLFSGDDAVPYLREKPISEIAPVYEQRSIRFL